MKKNDIVRVEISDISFDGQGIGRNEDGFVIFVKEGLPGEIIDVHITKVLKNLAYGKIENIIEKSPYRTESLCTVSKKCGGCCYMHTSYENELEIKAEIINNALKTILKTDIKTKPVLGGESLHYRNKMLIPFGIDENGKINAGFYRKRTHEIIPCDNCLISSHEFESIKNTVIEFARQKNLTAYNEETGKGLLRHLYIRKAYHTNEIMAGLVINANALPEKEEFINTLTSNYKNIKSIVININKKKTNVILGEKTVAIYNNDYITDIMNKNKVQISCQSFYQVNTPQAENLYNIAMSHLDSENDIVFDLYCGIGTISMCLAKKAKRVYGVESCEPAVKNANQNKNLNNIENLEFICDLSENAVPKLISEGIIPTTVVLDPPRGGCEKSLVDTIIKANPKKIIYISCNPATLARDLSIFSETYKIQSVQGVDLFPKTQHVECVVLMSRIEK